MSRIFQALTQRMAYNFRTVYLFVCNYNFIVLLWAGVGTICSKNLLRHTTHPSTDHPLPIHQTYIRPTPNILINTTPELGQAIQFGDTSDWTDSLKRFSASLTWVFIVALSFSISNQRHPASVQEDKVNKPWRPLPSYRITSAQASRLLLVTTTVGLFFSISFGGLWPYILQLVASYHYNDLGGAKGHHFVRGLLNAVGMTAWLFGCVDVARGRDVQFSKSELTTGLVLVASIVSTIAIQDFRDFEGDYKCGRATLPIVLGESQARAILAVSMLVWSYGILVVFKLRLISAVSGLGTVIAVRLFLLRNRTADKLTMELWYLWFAAVSLAIL